MKQNGVAVIHGDPRRQVCLFQWTVKTWPLERRALARCMRRTDASLCPGVGSTARCMQRFARTRLSCVLYWIWRNCVVHCALESRRCVRVDLCPALCSARISEDRAVAGTTRGCEASLISARNRHWHAHALVRGHDPNGCRVRARPRVGKLFLLTFRVVLVNVVLFPRAQVRYAI